jgi:hypothetical protein
MGLHLLLRVQGVKHPHPPQPLVVPRQRPQPQRLPWSSGRRCLLLQLRDTADIYGETNSLLPVPST